MSAMSGKAESKAGMGVVAVLNLQSAQCPCQGKLVMQMPNGSLVSRIKMMDYSKQLDLLEKMNIPDGNESCFPKFVKHYMPEMYDILTLRLDSTSKCIMSYVLHYYNVISRFCLALIGSR